MNENVKIKDDKVDISEPSVIKDFFLTSGGEKELGVLFGQSETEIKKEFGAYKAQKIYRRINYFIDSRNKLMAEVQGSLKEALKYGFYGVTVFSNLVSLSKSTLKGLVRVRALIGYPYGEELYKSMCHQIKYAVKDGADEILIPFSTFNFRTQEAQELVKTFKKIVQTARGRRVFALIDLSVLTLPEVESAIAVLLGTGVYGVILSHSNGQKSITKTALEDAISVSCGLVKVECFTPVNNAEEAVSLLLSGANGIISKTASEVAVDLTQKIESLGALENA